MLTLYDTISLGQNLFLLKIEERTNDPFIECNGKNYQSLIELATDVPELSDKENINTFAKVANFLFRGQEAVLIEDINTFQKSYPVIARSLYQYGIYDVSGIRAPEVRDDEAIFYAEHSTMHVPYRVTCTFPYTSKESHFHYALLKEIYD